MGHSAHLPQPEGPVSAEDLGGRLPADLLEPTASLAVLTRDLPRRHFPTLSARTRLRKSGLDALCLAGHTASDFGFQTKKGS